MIDEALAYQSASNSLVHDACCACCSLQNTDGRTVSIDSVPQIRFAAEKKKRDLNNDVVEVLSYFERLMLRVVLGCTYGTVSMPGTRAD